MWTIVNSSITFIVIIIECALFDKLRRRTWVHFALSQRMVECSLREKSSQLSSRSKSYGKNIVEEIRNWMNLSWTLRMFFTFSSLVKHKPLTSFVWEIYWPNFISMCVYPSANRTSPTGNWIFVSQTPSCCRQRSSHTKLPIPSSSSEDELYVNDLKIVRGNSSAISHEIFKNFSR